MTLYSCDSPPLLGRTSPQVWVSAQESVSVQITQQMMLRRESLTCLLLCITDLKCICKLFSDAILTGWPQRNAFLLLKVVCVYFSYYLPLVTLQKLDDYCTSSRCKHLLQTERRGIVKFYLSECSDVALPAHVAAVGSSRCAVGLRGLDEI